MATNNKNIDWESIAKDHGLSFKEFENEMFFNFIALIDMKLDEIDIVDVIGHLKGDYNIQITATKVRKPECLN